MELRVLRYFLAVAREGSITGAASSLHLSQPTLSRQLHDLEKELGKQLMIRGTRRITLTEEGIMLRHRAEEILALVSRTKNEVSLADEIISGDIHIKAGETGAVRYLAQTARLLQMRSPGVRCHISSGDRSHIKEQLERGLIDFGVLFGTISHSHFNAIRLPPEDHWGLLMHNDNPLSSKRVIHPEDIWVEPLIFPCHEEHTGTLTTWLQREYTSLRIVATYSSFFNASLMVESGVGSAVALDGIINVTGNSSLCFRPFTPTLTDSVNVICRKHQFLSRPAVKYLEILRGILLKV